MRVQSKVVPGASRDELSASPGDSLNLRLGSPAEAGKANVAVIRWLSTLLSVAHTSLRIVSGLSLSPRTLEIDGLDEAAFYERMQAAGH